MCGGIKGNPEEKANLEIEFVKFSLIFKLNITFYHPWFLLAWWFRYFLYAVSWKISVASLPVSMCVK